MKRILSLSCVLVGVGVFGGTSASAQVGGAGPIAKQRAREQVNQSNVRQGAAAPVQPQQPPPASTTPPAQNVSLTRLQTALANFKSDGTFTPQQKQRFTNDLFAAALSTKPAPPATEKLADDMALVLVGKPLSATSRSRFATELDAVLNPSKYPQAKIQAIYDDIQAIFQENGADRKQAAAIVEDVKAFGTR
jgi:hypothetical protein